MDLASLAAMTPAGQPHAPHPLTPHHIKEPSLQIRFQAHIGEQIAPRLPTQVKEYRSSRLSATSPRVAFSSSKSTFPSRRVVELDGL